MSIGLYNMLTALAYAKNDPRSYLNVSGKRTQGSSPPVWFIYVLLYAVFSSREDAVEVEIYVIFYLKKNVDTVSIYLACVT